MEPFWPLSVHAWATSLNAASMQIRSLSRDCSTISRRIPLSPLATVSPCPYQENIRWRWAALACWLKHAQQRANFEFATDFFAVKGFECGQFRLNPQARARVPGLSMRPRMRGTPYHVGLFVVKLEWGLRCGVGSFFNRAGVYRTEDRHFNQRTTGSTTSIGPKGMHKSLRAPGLSVFVV